MKNFDVVFIGSGPGGYVGAIRAAQLGLKTAIVEKDKTFGGTCLNVGCIPSKALLESSEHFHAAKHSFSEHGIELKNGVELNLKGMMERKNNIVKSLTDGISFLFKKNKIEVFKALGRLKSANEIELTLADGGTDVISSKYIVLATGSVPVSLPFLPPIDEKQIVTSTGALSLEKVPKSMVVIGAGVIGLEMGSVWSRLGTKVTAIEYADKICGQMDGESTKVFQKILNKSGMEFILSAKVVACAKQANSLMKVTYELLKDSSKNEIEAEVVLVSVGRKPFSDGLGLKELGIEQDAAGRVVVGEHMETTKYPHIFAIGDLIRGPMLAHKAEEEGVAVAEFIATGYGHVNYHTVPSIIYTHPEFASVGFTEEELKAKQIPYKAGKFPFLANGRAKAIGFTEGQVKILAHAENDKILGAHIVGPKASELLQEVVVAMEFGGSSEDLARSFHGHPTLSEVVREAALAVDKRQRQM